MAGIALVGSTIVVAAVRAEPLRLTALARSEPMTTAIAAGDIRIPQVVVAELTALRQMLKLAESTPAVMAMQPRATELDIAIDAGPEPTVEVNGAQVDRARSVVAAAGFELSRIDVIPAALARAALVENPSAAGLRSPDGWSVAVDVARLRARHDADTGRDQYQIGPDPDHTVPLTELRGLTVPDELRSVLDPARDLPAIGAALGGLGLRPLLTAVPVASIGAVDWRLTQVAGLA